MNPSPLEAIARVLQHIPDGVCTNTGPQQAGVQTPFLSQTIDVRLQGKGMLTHYTILPGVEATFLCLLTDTVQFSHDPLAHVLEIYYCRRGRAGWNLDDGTTLYLGEGDLTWHTMDRCADSAMLFPLGYSEGLSLSLDLVTFAAHLPPFLAEAGIDVRRLREKLCTQPATITETTAVRTIFEPLFDLPETWRPVYLRLKFAELLLFLWRWEPQSTSVNRLPSQQTALVKEIHDHLLAHLDQRFTAAELSARYPISRTTLKNVFKQIYGQPLGHYMKTARVQAACRLLSESDASIAEIAAQVGYETQSKFTQAFKAVTGILPKDYRKQHH